MMGCNASFQLLQNVLARGGFAITAEVTPPRGADVSRTLEAAAHLLGRVHAVNVTDGSRAMMGCAAWPFVDACWILALSRCCS